MKLRILAVAVAVLALGGCTTAQRFVGWDSTLSGGGTSDTDRCMPCKVTVTVTDDGASSCKLRFSPDPVYTARNNRVPIRFELSGANYSFDGDGVTFRGPPTNPRSPANVFKRDAGASGPQVVVYVDDRTHAESPGTWKYDTSVAAPGRRCKQDPMVDNN